MNKPVQQFLEHANDTVDARVSVASRALLLYKIAGKCEGYGTAMLDSATEYTPGLGPECFETAKVIQDMADKLLGYEKP